MKQSFFLAPSGNSVGLTSATLGLVRALDQVGLRVAFCKPIAQHAGKPDVMDPSLLFLSETQQLTPPQPILLSEAQQRLANGEIEQLMEDVVNLCSQTAQDADVLVVEGLVLQDDAQFINRINSHMASTLDSHIILVAAQNNLSYSEFNRHINISANYFGGTGESKVLGCILNKIGAPLDSGASIRAVEDVEEFDVTASISEHLPIFSRKNFHCIGEVPWDPALMAPRLSDVANYLSARIINDKGDMTRRVKAVTICARTLPNMLHTLRAGTLVVIPGDRDDLVVATAMASLNGIPIAGILLTGSIRPIPALMDLCHKAFDEGLPVLIVNENTITTAKLLDHMSANVPVNDIPRIEQVMNSVAEHIDSEWLAAQSRLQRQARLSPAAFRRQLVVLSNAKRRRIVLPEGDEPRTIQAAILCHQKGIADCILLGDEEAIKHTAEMNLLTIPDGIEIIDPNIVRESYVEPLVEMRKSKGLSPAMAASQLEDRVMLGTLMLALNEVDGLVSGAVNTTANTIRPALQIIKTSPNAKLVSSIFFMCLPEQVVVYGDCAVNPDPSAEELADIAIQSGDSAKAFGIEPRIAMISYSTGESGMGSDVDKVREATKIAKAKRPDLLLDGPLQYDAASVASVASKKAPNSPVAGKATVFIFPDLNTGNTTYKAVQRSANVVSIGPMLQGLRKPVNDLSRGALVEDIVYTIALTVIQANQCEEAQDNII